MPTQTKVKAPYVLDEQRGYRLIEDKPLEELPIRRLQKQGEEVLNANELLQVALGKVDGLDDLIRDYGSGFLTRLKSVQDVMDTMHLDALQASRLIAILALGKRLYAAPQGSMVQIRGIEDVYQHFRPMAHLAKEQLRVCLINSRYQLVHEETLAIGSTEYLHIRPRDVFQSAIERRVNAIILVHNHPTGDATASESDLSFTKEIKQAGVMLGIELLDHVIIGSDTYTSCLETAKKATK